MDIRTIKKLIELINETGVGEIEVKSGDDSVRISCYRPSATPVPERTIVAVNPAPVETAPPATPIPAVAAQPETKANYPTCEGYTLSSPMVGTVYLAPAPGSKPFVEVGQHVNVGDTLCMIEAMKMFNKIEADKAGVVSARLIENEQPVEYEQALFMLELDD